MAGPLAGLRVVEMAGIGPGSFAAMILADHGAEVIRVDRYGAKHNPSNPLLHSRLSVVLDLKVPGDVPAVRDLCRGADALIEGLLPRRDRAVGSRPDVLLADNLRLVYGRMTG